MIEVKINGVVKWQVNEYTVVDPQMGIRSISLTVTHPSDNATVPSFVGAYVEYEGERYDIANSKPTAEKGIDSINYKYNLVFYGQEAELQRRKIRNLATVGVDTFISQGTSFSLYADINQFKQLLENNLKYYFGNKWTINLGSTTSESVMVSVNNMSIWDLLLKTFEYYGLRWNITGNTINIGYTPDVIQHVFDYGYDGGLVKITRTAQSEPTINRLVGVGGSRNVPINYFTNRHSGFPVDPNPISGDVNIKNIMPKVFRDSVIAGTLPYIDYVEDAALVASEGVKEDALEPNEDIYPSIAGVEVAGLGRIDQIIAASVPTADNPDDAGYSPTFDIWVKDIGFDLADNQYTATQDAKISFTSGMLAGYEFVILTTNGVRNVVVDTTKSHGGVSSKYKITLIKSSEDFTATGRMLPNSVIKAMPGDSFVIHDIIMPQTYVELAELRVQNWLNEQLDIKKVEKPTYAIELTDTFFEENIAPESDGKTIREKLKSGNKLTINNTKVTDGAQELHINNITIQYGGLLPKYSFVVTDKVSVQGSAIARLTNEIQKTDNSVQATDKKIVKLQQYSDRQWKEIQETITLLSAAIDGFSTGINPITVQTMQALVGNESLQFRFVNSKTAPVAVSHAFNWDDVLKSFTTPSGIIQHMTLGITEISSNHPVSAYKFWDIASYSNNTLVAEKPYYLYSKCSRTTSGAVFLLSDVPIGMYDDANYYYFLTGILNSEDSNGGRSFVSLYGFTEILPGRITTDKIVSSDGLTYFDLLNGVIGGKIRFASTGGGETNLADWADGTSQDIQDAQAAANAAALKAQQAIDDAEANVGLINTEVSKLQAQIDGEVSNWFYPYSPTLANYPASDWTTNEIKDRHIGDTFTNTQTFVDDATTPDAGKSWRFVKNGSTYSWTVIADSDAVLALQKAAQAQATADGKSTTHLFQPTKYKLGDMWVLNADRTINGTAYKQGEILTATQDSTTFNEAHWLKRVRYTDDTAVNNLEIGGRNLAVWAKMSFGYLWNGQFNSVPVGGQDRTTDYIEVKDTDVITVSLYESVQHTGIGRMYAYNEDKVYIGTIADNIDWKEPNSASYNLPKNTKFIRVTLVKWGEVKYKVEKGNKATDWTPAPEDVQAEINNAKQEALTAAGNAQNTANSLKNFTDTAFRDGIIDRSESVAIEKYKNSLNEAMAKAEASYNKVYTNTYLEGTAKTNLLNAKINLWGQRDTLLSAINTAISGGTTTPAQKTAVDNAFSTFNNLMAAFQNALEEANKAIQAKLDALSTEKVEDIEIGGRNLVQGGDYIWDNAPIDVPLGSYGQSIVKRNINVEPDTTYTLNYVKGSTTPNLVVYQFSEEPTHVSHNGYYGSPVKIAEVSTSSIPFTFKTPSNCTNISLTTGNIRSIDGKLEYKKIKLEKGNKATDWTPAPEDVQAEIDAAVVKATYWSIKASAPVIYKDAINAATSGTHTPVTVSGELRSGTTTTQGGFITVTPNGGMEAGTASASPVTIAPADSDGKTSYTVKLYDTASKTTLLDTMTIPVVFKGASGVNAISAVLSNEADVLPASPEGTVSDYSGSGTDIIVYEGGTRLTYGTGNGQFQVSASGSGISVGSASTVSGNIRRYANASNMTSDNATIVFTITGKTADGTSFSLTKTQSFAKSRTGQKGDTGASAPLLYLSASAQVMKCNPDNTPQTGQTISIEAKLQNVSGTATFVATPYNDAGVAQTPVTLGGTGNTRTLTNAQWLATYKRIEVVATLGSLTDKVTIYRVADGATGKGISETEIKYQVGASGTTTPTGTWLTSVPAVPEGQFLWTRTVTSYTDGTSTTSYSVSKQGVSGSDGKGISSTVITYQASSSGTVVPTGTWSGTIPSVSENQFLWTRTVITYTDSSTSTSYSVGKMGAKGDAGQNAIVGLLTNESVTLQANSAGVVSSFTPANGEFWVYNGTTKVTSGITFSKVSETGCTAAITSAGVYSVSAMSADNATVVLRAVYGGVTIDKVLTLSKSRAGADGVSITLVDVEFAKNTNPTTAPTTGWTTTAPTLTGTEQLWTRTKTAYSSGNPTYSTPANITPKTGATGTGIDSVTEEFAISSSKTVQPTTGWSTTQPTWIQGQYIWSRVKVVYKNPTSTVYTGYAVSSEWEAINNLEIGGRNLALNTATNIVAIGIGQANQILYNGYNALDFVEQGIKTDDFVTITYYWKVRSLDSNDIYGNIYLRPNSLLLDNSTSFNYYNTPRQYFSNDVTSGYTSETFQVGNVRQITDFLFRLEAPTNVEITIYKLKLEKGNKATDWTPAPEDVQAEIDNAAAIAADAQAKANASKAITDKFGTTVDGGLINTVITEFREADSEQVTGLISGIQGANKDLPFLVAGGTYAEGIAGTAKAIIRHDGTVKFTDAEIRGTVYATNGEFAGTINATSGTIGGFKIIGSVLKSTSLTGGIDIEVQGEGFFHLGLARTGENYSAFLSIRNDKRPAVDIQSYGSVKQSVKILANTTGYGLSTYGALQMIQRSSIDSDGDLNEEIVCMPGVLHSRTMHWNGYSMVTDSQWGNGCYILGVERLGTGKYKISHNIGHTRYSIYAMPENDSADWAGFCSLHSKNSNDFTLLLSGTGGKSDKKFSFVIIGRPPFGEQIYSEILRIKSITTAGATIKGQIKYTGGMSANEVYVCYSTSQNPTIYGNKKLVENYGGIGMFSCPISGLSNNTTYYVRIAVTSGGSVYYSPQKIFTTISQLPVVYTGGAGIVTNNSAIIYTNYVESDGGSAVINRGIKYSTNSNPIEYGNTVPSGSGTGNFDVELTGLMSYTTYYYCAFATNSYGTSYGDIRSFTTEYY